MTRPWPPFTPEIMLRSIPPRRTMSTGHGDPDCGNREALAVHRKDPDDQRTNQRPSYRQPAHSSERSADRDRLSTKSNSNREVHGARPVAGQHRVSCRLARTFDLPVVLSTVNVANGQGPTLPELKAVLSSSEEIDRTQINSWEDVEFRRAVEATGRKKLIMAALWTEVCLAFPTLDALREGFEVYPVVDAVGGTSPEAHRAGLERIVQAGAQPISWVSLACELQRDWARVETVPEVVDIVLTTRLLKSA